MFMRWDRFFVNLVSKRPRASKLEFFVALALVALAQSGKGS
jgi:sorting nexin-8